MNWASQDFQGRFKLAGDLSERACEEWMEQKGVSIERFGFNRSQLPRFWKLPLKLRTRPDYLAMGKHPFFIEVKGCGTASYIKIKELTLDGLSMWQQELDIWMFFYDSHHKRISFTHYPIVHELAQQSPFDFFQEGHKYYKLPKKQLTWEDFQLKEYVYGY